GDGSWVDARHAGTASSAEGRRLPTLRRSSVRGSQSASSLPRGRSRLTAGRSIESLDAKKTRNESRGGSYDSFRNLPRHSLILCCRSDQLVNSSPHGQAHLTPPPPCPSPGRRV